MGSVAISWCLQEDIGRWQNQTGTEKHTREQSHQQLENTSCRGLASGWHSLECWENLFEFCDRVLRNWLVNPSPVSINGLVSGELMASVSVPYGRHGQHKQMPQNDSIEHQLTDLIYLKLTEENQPESAELVVEEDTLLSTHKVSIGSIGTVPRTFTCVLY